MKSLAVGLLATAVAVFATVAIAAPAFMSNNARATRTVVTGVKTPAFNFNDAYEVTFNYPGGSFQHCIQLTATQQIQGYINSGTWVDTDFSGTSGTWVLVGNVFHLAGPVDGAGYLTIDGKTGNNILRQATFDYFDNSGNYFAGGSVTVAVDSSCAS